MQNLKPIHVFDMNGTLIAKELGAVCENYAREHVFIPLFETILNLSDENWARCFPEAAENDLSKKIVYDRILPLVANPPKFTKAREAYYNIIEAEIRKKKIDMGLETDVLQPAAVLSILKRAGIDTLLFSRGTVSLIDAILDGVDLRACFTLFDSTIAYGNSKVKSTYLNLIKSLAEKSYAPVAFYEDEAAPLKELYETGKEIEAETGTFPFRLFWINRENVPTEELTNLVAETTREDLLKKVTIHEDTLFDPLT